MVIGTCFNKYIFLPCAYGLKGGSTLPTPPEATFVSCVAPVVRCTKHSSAPSLYVPVLPLQGAFSLPGKYCSQRFAPNVSIFQGEGIRYGDYISEGI